MNIHKYLERKLAQRLSSQTSELRKLKRAWRGLVSAKNADDVSYAVHLHDGREGEGNILVRSKHSIERAMQRATAKYKTANNCRDVQAQCKVWAFVPTRSGDVLVTLPDSFWRQCFDKHSKAPTSIPQDTGGTPFDG
jgi:hypothetical protein